jgi:FkbM family methyltransferase
MAARLAVAANTTLLGRDGDLLHWRSPSGDSWISAAQDAEAARFRAPDLYHWPPRWAEDNHARLVGRGDVVIDGGGHIGESSRQALEFGASKVVAVEPDPLNAEAIRRNLSRDVAEGRLVVIEKGLWSHAGVLRLERHEASAMTTLEEGPAEKGLEIPVVTIDGLVAELGLDRVDFIKLDIEGSERQALQGASDTLARLRPRLAIGTYHQPGDLEAIEQIVARLQPAYSKEYYRCLPSRGELFPHLLILR